MVAVLVVSAPGRQRRKRRTTSRLHRMSLRRRNRRQARSTADVLDLAKNSQLYSALLNNYTLSDNVSSDSDSDSGLHDRYDASVVYYDRQLTITNLRHFQEYSIEVRQSARVVVVVRDDDDSDGC